MCGICGFINFGKRITEKDRRVIQCMNKTLIHRGPDAQDTVCFDNVAFGFTRLSIIGLGNGMQPIWNEEETIALICNGEIFNYIELRKELLLGGHRFRTESDVEVILHLYEQYDTGFLNRLNGQFAFAIYDKRKKQLFCARDQAGILPFYYATFDNTFIFGSEIKAILEHPAVIRKVDLVGLDQVFTFAGLISPRTMFQGISSLENGHFLLVGDGGRIRNQEYWDLHYPEEGSGIENGDKAGIEQELESLFERAVELRLRSDVQSGLYVSGGLDSSMIAMKVSQMQPNERKEAFSIDFIDSLHSESHYQKLVADASNSALNQQIFKYKDISERLWQSIYHCECPLKETYNTASLALSENVRANNIKVVLSGEGADEFFAGYVGYRFDKMRAMNLIQSNASAEELQLRERLWGDPSFFYERNFTEFNEVKKRIYSDKLNSQFDEFNCLNHPVVNKERLTNRDVLNKRAYIDYKVRLVDHLVSDHGDRMAMANSVEVRYPFLDKDLIEFSTRIPSELKLNDFTEKFILREMGSRFVPPSVIEREKFHFIAPGSPYLLQGNTAYLDELLSYERIKEQGFFNPDEISKIKNVYSQKGFTVNAPYESDLLITVITFGMLLDLFI
jgi:asparagine synthase (glutamine-hydrolysing)